MTAGAIFGLIGQAFTLFILVLTEIFKAKAEARAKNEELAADEKTFQTILARAIGRIQKNPQTGSVDDQVDQQLNKPR